MLGTGGPGVALSAAPVIRLAGLRKGALRFPDLSIAPGEAVALTGPSGSGKSTLIALIGGLERPDGGAIHLDGVPLGADTADGWRAQVAWVPQAAQFLDGPLRDGLLLGARGRPTEADIAAALALAAATGVVARLPQGLDTVLGETGGGVSGGEARRTDAGVPRPPWSAPPPWWLGFDEATAGTGPGTAGRVIAASLPSKARPATLESWPHARPRCAANRVDGQLVLVRPRQWRARHEPAVVHRRLIWAEDTRGGFARPDAVQVTGAGLAGALLGLSGVVSSTGCFWRSGGWPGLASPSTSSAPRRGCRFLATGVRTAARVNG